MSDSARSESINTVEPGCHKHGNRTVSGWALRLLWLQLVSVGRIIHVHLLDALRGMYDVDLNAIQIWWIHLISSIVLRSYMSSGIVGIVVSCLIILIGSR